MPDEIDDALAVLPALQRAVLVLHYMDQLSVRDVARSIGKSEAATASLLARGRDAFRQSLPGDRPMNDERLFERLAAHAGPADVDPAFEDHLYGRLQREMLRTGRWSRPMLLLAAALLLGLAAAGAALVGSGILRLPDLSGGSAARLAYGLDGDIYLADWDGANPVRIADGEPPGPGCGNFWGEGSMWSPDGRYFAYRGATGGDCPNEVYVRDAEGDLVATVPGYGWLVSWSPDSTRFATWVEPYETIGIYGIDGVRQVLLTLPAGHPVQGDYDPVWSPDGRSVFLPLAPEPDGPSEIWELPIDGGAPQRVPDEDPRSHRNSWLLARRRSGGVRRRQGRARRCRGGWYRESGRDFRSGALRRPGVVADG